MSDTLLQHIDRLKTQRPVAKDVMDAYRELAMLMEEADSSVGSVNIDIDARHNAIKSEEGFPLFQETIFRSIFRVHPVC
ncbi:MAG: hypothetical protein U5R49_08030 [Deltaproteobacteria bacterium]|nr:hypothetical protein [Deltaproteobacteria bacterium]